MSNRVGGRVLGAEVPGAAGAGDEAAAAKPTATAVAAAMAGSWDCK